jgi:hypothetical protein
MIQAADLVNRMDTLTAEARVHKSAIRRHRRELGDVTAQLKAVEAECRRLGIGFRQEHRHHGTDGPHTAAD